MGMGSVDCVVPYRGPGSLPKTLLVPSLTECRALQLLGVATKLQHPTGLPLRQTFTIMKHFISGN